MTSRSVSTTETSVNTPRSRRHIGGEGPSGACRAERRPSAYARAAVLPSVRSAGLQACRPSGGREPCEMPQLLHLLIVDHRERTALVARYGSRWLLPLLSSRERTRVDPLITRWLAEQGLVGSVTGHWLGRLARAQDSMDWLVVVDASPGTRSTNPELTWTSLDTLVSGRSVLEYQQWAVAASLQCGSLPSVPGPFGNLTWMDDVGVWIRSVTGAQKLGATIPYRVTAYEVVLGTEVGGQRVYFKGLPPEREGEIRITTALSNLAPEVLARTLATERRPDGSLWWLISECQGRDLAGRTDPAMTARVARALARVQRDALTSATVIAELDCVPLADAAAWAASVLDRGTACSAIQQACAHVASAELPQSWIPLDLDPANVLVTDDGRVSFIDLDDSFVGPAPLAMAMFARRYRDRSGYEPYEEAWSPPLRGMDWPAFELAAAIVEAWLGWKGVVKNTDRGEVHCVLEVAARGLARTLTMAVTAARSSCPPLPGYSRLDRLR